MKSMIYTRQSMDKRNTQSSIKTQENLLRKYIEDNYPTITHVTSYSDVATGRNAHRPGFKRMMHAIESGTFAYLFLYRINRLSRNAKTFNQLLALCQKQNVIIVSLSDGVFKPDSSSDRLKAQLIGAIAEMESDTISKNYRSAFKERARNKQLLSSVPPWGYKYHNRFFIIEADKVTTVQQVFAWYCEGIGYKKISQLLNESNELLPRTPQQVKAIITNSKYAGRIDSSYGSYMTDYIEPMISPKIFNKVSSIRNKKRTVRTDGPRAILRRKVLCPYCKAILTPIRVTNRGKTLEYYDCSRNRQSMTRTCPMRQIPVKKLDICVQRSIERYLHTHHLIDLELSVIERIKKKYESNYKRSHNTLIHRLATREINVNQFKDMLQQSSHIKIQREELLKRLNQMKDELPKHLSKIPSEHINEIIDYAEVTPEGQLKVLKIKHINLLMKENII